MCEIYDPTLTSVIDLTESVIDHFELMQNYPNPFNPSTVINYALPVDANVTLKIYDILGKEITSLVKEHKEAGIHRVEFNACSGGGGLSSGVYIYQITAGKSIQAKKMILTK